MKIYLLSLVLILFFLGCEKRGGTPETIAVPPAPSATPAAEMAPNGAPVPPSPHPSSGAPVPFMQKLADYKARLDKNPKDIEALVFMGNANFDIQRFEKAKDFFVRALDVDPNNTFVRTDLASVYRNLGDSDKALQELNEVLKSNPNHETALYNSGIIYLNDKKDREKAAAVWTRLVKLKPNDPEAKELQAKIDEIKKK